MTEPGGLSRRGFLQTTAAALAGAAGATSATRASAAIIGISPGPEICESSGTVIDLHTHIFNALDLPIEGIFARWAGLVGRGAATIINAIALAKESSPGTPLDGYDAVIAATDQSEAEWAVLFADLAPPEIAHDERVVRAVAAAGDIDAATFARSSDRKLQHAAFASIFRKFLRALPPSIFAEDAAPEEAVRSTVSAGARWLWLMTEPEWKIASYLCRHTTGVGLFVHHLMDMEHYYPKGGPVRRVKFQPVRMREILRASNGRFVPFVAFDPKRGVSPVVDALSNGCVGVKVYPPNGYHADKESKPWQELFEYCVSKQVPILAHCTSHGFEAHLHKSGCNASPKYWAPVVAKWRDLRLCLGHAGGGGPWFGDTSSECGEDNFTLQALKLMNESENVYLEVAYFSKLFTADAVKVRDAILTSAHRYRKLETRLCYGTDWHMPSMFIHRPEDYLRKFQEVFAGVTWAPAFFHSNAAAYVNIAGFIERSSDAPWWTPAIAEHLRAFRA